jgi:hypothetical protein
MEALHVQGEENTTEELTLLVQCIGLFSKAGGHDEELASDWEVFAAVSGLDLDLDLNGPNLA